MKRTVVLGFLSALIAVALIIHSMPPADDFNPMNPFWNGLSKANEALKFSMLEDLRRVGVYAGVGEAHGLALLILGPSTPFTQEEAEAVKGFLMGGGLLILADDFGTGNELLTILGLDLRLNGSLLLDPLFKLKSRRLPEIIHTAGLEAEGLILNYATVITGSGFKTLATSSSFSYLDLNGNLEWDPDEPNGPFTVAAEAGYGAGGIIVISDPSFMINCMFEVEGNARLAGHLLKGRKPLLDTSHWRPSPLSKAKDILTTAFYFISLPEARYSLTSLVAIIILKTEYRRVRIRMSRVEEVLKRHPDWDKSILERLEEDLQHEG
ncbi:hypothetical protein KEJ49_07210 [Candidatus Bathyarchaeota archaeon]|nr:hypothetical protein [Candidatus Bathyarchaeota archaeon]